MYGDDDDGRWSEMTRGLHACPTNDEADQWSLFEPAYILYENCNLNFIYGYPFEIE